MVTHPVGGEILRLTQLGVRSSVSEVELDGKARKVAQARAPGARQLVSYDVWYWASLQGLAKMRKMKFDLVTVRFPCQQFSEANPTGAGLEGTEPQRLVLTT